MSQSSPVVLASGRLTHSRRHDQHRATSTGRPSAGSAAALAGGAERHRDAARTIAAESAKCDLGVCVHDPGYRCAGASLEFVLDH